MKQSSHRTLPLLGSGHPHEGDDLSRRQFVRLLSSAMAAAGVLGCNRAPEEEIVPYVRRPPEVIPGVARYYATTTLRFGYGVGLLAESHMGRPTKLEGHPEHPASRGGTLLQEQAEVLGLYDPDRARNVLRGGRIETEDALDEERARLVSQDGAGVHLLLDPTTSPLVLERLEAIESLLPGASVHFNPLSAPLNRWEGLGQLYGEPYDPQFDFTSSEVVVDLDSNFLAVHPMSISWSRDFMETRALRGPSDSMSRLYSMESAMSITGATADHRLAVPSSRVERITVALLFSIARRRGQESALPSSTLDPLAEPERRWIDAAADDLLKHPGRGVVVAGDRQPASVHAMAAAIDALLGNVGKSVGYCSPVLHRADEPKAYSLDPLLDALARDEVHTLFICGGNPSYTLPHEIEWQRLVRRARHVVQLSLYENESSSEADWFVPEKHFLETWGDARAYDGTISFRQPLIRPLYGGKSLEEMLAWIAGEVRAEGKSLLERLWVQRLGDREQFQAALSRGIVPDSKSRLIAPQPAFKRLAPIVAEASSQKAGKGLELDLLPDPRLEDGRLANNAWLQETPEPITKLVWDNALLMNPRVAKERGLVAGDVVHLRSENRSIDVPVLPVPGQAKGAVSLWLGFGRSGSERLASGVGVDASPLRSRDSPWIVGPVTLHKTGRRHELVRTQTQFEMRERPIALHATLEGFRRRPERFRSHREDLPTTFSDRTTKEVQWAMAIDLNKCTGCSTCVTACMAENNIPVVGKELVALGREMHWMRIDTYRAGAATLMQPMLCQHCEKAPCEYVCPVSATVHSEDGLNEMVYNRCVGTRFCSNNCPYKVRRFNWFDFNRNADNPKLLVFNPDVTVRARGVMEKCTFCVQRIRRAEIDAKLNHRQLAEGDVTTACAQACPTRAIEFGPISDPRSRVSQLHHASRAYACLNEVGTRPRVRYLARIVNVKKGAPR